MDSEGGSCRRVLTIGEVSRYRQRRIIAKVITRSRFLKREDKVGVGSGRTKKQLYTKECENDRVGSCCFKKPKHTCLISHLISMHRLLNQTLIPSNASAETLLLCPYYPCLSLDY
jgi:hypothetical protein